MALSHVAGEFCRVSLRTRFVQCGPSEGQEKPAPLYMFEPEDDLFENYGAASGTVNQLA